MSIVSAFAGVWMAFISLFGVFNHATPMQLQGGQDSSTPQARNQQIDMPAVYQTAGQSSSNQTSQSSSNSNSQTSSASATSVTLPSIGEAWLASLTLGDSKYVTAGPEQGYIYVCHVASGSEGAQGTPTWISGNTWYPSEKVAVEGSVAWPNAYYSMTISGSTRIIKSNGEPTDHDTGIFPIQASDPAHQFDANPNSIEAQQYDFSLPAYPSLAATPNCIYGEVGIMNDGVPLFDGFDAEYRDAVAHETQDAWEGHPDEDGVYHDHGFESGYVQDSVSEVVGFAFDGFPITGSKMPDGTYLHTNDLDECHGLTSAITLDGKTVTTYHYVLTQDFPYSVSCFRGTSYEPKPGGGSSSQSAAQSQSSLSGQTQQGSAPPQAAIDACSGKSAGTSCAVQNGPTGTCQTPPNQTSLACIP